MLVETEIISGKTDLSTLFSIAGIAIATAVNILTVDSATRTLVVSFLVQNILYFKLRYMSIARSMIKNSIVSFVDIIGGIVNNITINCQVTFSFPINLVMLKMT